MSIKIRAILSFFILSLLNSPAFADEKLPLDAVVAMDSSGSMKKTDPKELRKPAAKLFINLLGKQDRLSVMSFSSQAWPITFMTSLDTDKNISKSMRATDKVSSKGLYTNIYAAIKRGINLLKNSENNGHDPIIVLMSDGQMDVGDKARSAELRQKIFDELVPLLKQYHIKIYSIAFTQNSDQSLLQEIADATDGRYALAASDDVLHKVFAKIFEQSKEPNMLPLTENAFTVDPSIREITIIANKASEKSQILLEDPDGKRLNSTFKSPNIKWFVSSSFDMITLTKPKEGQWKILFSDNDNKAYIVADVKLRTEFAYNTNSETPVLEIKTWLEKDDKIVDADEVISTMKLELEIEHPNGQVDTQPFDEITHEGVFITDYEPTEDGIYGASVIARSKTFERQQVFSFRATLPQALPEVAKPEVVVEQPAPAAEEKPAQAEPPEDDLMQALKIFVIGNLILLFIAINVFFIFKMMKNKK